MHFSVYFKYLHIFIVYFKLLLHFNIILRIEHDIWQLIISYTIYLLKSDDNIWVTANYEWLNDTID
jgi:hypothetical protein